MRLIVTRPEPDASRTAEALRRLGHEPIVSPVLDIVHNPDAHLPGGQFQAVIVTSRNAVRALAAHPERNRVTGTPVLAVGDQTALEAKRAGFDAARSAGGNVDDLVRLATRELDRGDGPVLYLAGDEQAGDPAARLHEHGFRVEIAVIYRAVPRPGLTSLAADALRQNGKTGVLLYSRRSAVAFAAAAREAGLAPLPPSVTAFCISEAAAEPLASLVCGAVLVAARPDQLALFALVEGAAAGYPPISREP